MTTSRLGVPLVALLFLAAGCAGGGGGGSGIQGLTAYHAANVARDAMDEEVLDPESLAYDKTWLVDDTNQERLEDGTWAWRITFIDVSDQSSTLCVWVQLDDRTFTVENLTYFLDRCPTPSQS